MELGAQRSLHPYSIEKPVILNTGASAQWRRHSIYIQSKRLGVGFVNDMVTMLLSVEADLIQILHNAHSRLFLPISYSSLAEMSYSFMDVWPLYYWTQTTFDSQLFSYKTSLHSHLYPVKDFLCSHILSFLL